MTGRRSGAGALVGGILELAARGLERIADGHINVLMRSVRGGLAAYRDIGRLRNHKMDADLKGVALVMAALRLRNDHARANDVVVKLLKLLYLFPDTRLNRIGVLYAIEGNLKWNLHGITSS